MASSAGVSTRWHVASRNRVCSGTATLRPRHALIGDGLRRPSAAAYARTRVGKRGGRGSCHGVRISGTMPRRRARTGNSYSPLCAAILRYRLRLGVELRRSRRRHHEPEYRAPEYHARVSSSPMTPVKRAIITPQTRRFRRPGETRPERARRGNERRVEGVRVRARCALARAYLSAIQLDGSLASGDSRQVLHNELYERGNNKATVM